MKPRSLAYLLMLLGLAAALAGCSRSQTAVEFMDEPSAMVVEALEHDGIEREYLVHVPESEESSLPVVLAIHGYTSTASGFVLTHGLKRHADANGYILVAPQGSFFEDERTSPASLITSWNDLAANLPETDSGPHCLADSYRYPCPPECGECSHCAWTSCYDDLGFIDRLLDEVHSAYPTDPDRTYVLGVSNGAMMALRVGCNLSHRFAGVAPIIGQLAPGYACAPRSNVPMIHLFGGEDDTVRVDGRPAADGYIYETPETTAAVWASALSCTAGPSDWPNSIAREAGLQCTARSQCAVAGQEVVSCLDPDGAHAWPEQRVGNLPATCTTAEQHDSIPGAAKCPPDSGEYIHHGMDLIWQFFSRYQRVDGELVGSTAD